MDGALAAVVQDIIGAVHAFTRRQQGIDGVPQPDSLTTALLAYPELCGDATTYAVEVDEREGLTHGYLSVDVHGVTDRPAHTCVVEPVDEDGFRDVVLAPFRDHDPDRALAA